LRTVENTLTEPILHHMFDAILFLVKI